MSDIHLLFEALGALAQAPDSCPSLTHVEDAWDGIALLGELSAALELVLSRAAQRPAQHSRRLLQHIDEALAQAEWEVEDLLASVASPRDGNLRIAAAALRFNAEAMHGLEGRARGMWPGVLPKRGWGRCVGHISQLEANTWARRDLEQRLELAVSDVRLERPSAAPWPGDWASVGLIGPVLEHLDRLLTGYTGSRYKRLQRLAPPPSCVEAALSLIEPALEGMVQDLTDGPPPAPELRRTAWLLLHEGRQLSQRALQLWPAVPSDLAHLSFLSAYFCAEVPELSKRELRLAPRP